MQAVERLMTIEEVAETLRLTVRTVKQMCRERRLPCVKVSNRWRVRPSDLQAYLSRAE